MNKQKFKIELTAAYVRLFETQEYAFAASFNTPETLAEKMTNGLASGTANHDGDGIRAACRACGIKPTKTAIRFFLNS